MVSPDSEGSPRADRDIAAALALLLAAVYLVTGAYHFFTVDEVATFAVARSLAGHGGVEADGLSWVAPLLGEYAVTATGPDGHAYSLKDVGPSVILVPWIALGDALNVSPIRVAYFFPIAITALTGGLLYLAARSFGFSARTSILGGLLFGLGSMALPYSKWLFTQPVAALGLTIAVWGAIASRKGRSWGPALWSGLGLGLAGVSAAPTWATLPVYVMCIAGWPGESHSAWRETLKARWPTALGFGLGAGAFAAAQGFYNLVRFGSPLTTGHTEIGATLDPSYLGLGLWANLVSTPRGLVWFAPFVLLIPFAVRVARRGSHLWLQVACLSQALILLIVYSMYFNWPAGLSYGPRFLAPAMPALVISTLPLLDHLPGLATWQRLLAWGLMGFSALTQIAAGLFDFSRVERAMFTALGRVTPPPSFFAYDPVLLDPANLIYAHVLAVARRGWWDVVWMSRGSPDWPLLVAMLAAAALAGVVLARAARGHGGLWSSVLGLGQAGLMLAIAIWIVVGYPHAIGYARAELPPIPGLDQAAGALRQRLAPGDGTLLLFDPETHLAWLDIPYAAPPEVGLTLEAPLRPQTIQILAAVPRWHQRVWVVAQGSEVADPHNGVEAWLAQHAFVGVADSVEDFRIVSYSFSPDPGGLKDASATWDDGAIRLLGYAFAPGGGGLNVRLRWGAVRAVQQDYTVFIHLMGPSGLVSQHDGPPVAGYAPTTGWLPGQMIDDRHNLALAANVPPGDYALVVGLYDSATGQPLPVDGSGETGQLLERLQLP